MERQIQSNAKEPRILLFDIETSPNIIYTWGKYEQDALGDIIQERKIISFAWKWFKEKTVHANCIPDFYPIRNGIKNNLKLIEKLHSLFSAADILVAQNGDNFDIKMANAEFIQYGLTPTPPSKSIDTLKVAKARFRFNSNKLDDIGARLGLGRKLKHEGFDMWVRCMAGDREAWNKMVAYNKQDVILLEKIYVKMRPWIKNHPNMNIMDGKSACPTCKSPRVIRCGISFTRKGTRQKYKCKGCGRWSLGAFASAGLTLDPA